MTVTNERIAELAHEINRVYCEWLGDNSQKPWADAPDWARQSAINGVEFHLAGPFKGQEASHNNWMAEKLRAGWRHGPVKDADKREHPCLLPYDFLPEEQKVKDGLFAMAVHLVNGAFRKNDGCPVATQTEGA